MTLQEQNLTEEQYENCLSDITDKVNGVSDLDWSEIVAKYNLNMASDTLRKASQTIFGGAFVKQFIDGKHQTVDTDDNSSYEIQLREIRREKQKLFDERMAFNKSNRDIARLQQDLDYLEEIIKNSQYQPIDSNITHYHTEKDLVVLLSDLHIGLNVKSSFGEYNSSIAKDMLRTYLNEVLKAIELYNIECYLEILLMVTYILLFNYKIEKM